MDRVCGAVGEQKASVAANCWCRGQFCGKGGALLSERFRREFRTHAIASSLSEFADLVSQPNLFRGDDTRNWWLWRIDPRRDTWERLRARSSSSSSSSSSSR